MSDPDIIYVVRENERNDALWYSLRSLSNLPHRRVFIAGYCPSWVENVTAIPVRRNVNKFESIEANLRAALRHPEIGEHVVYFNDDFFVTEPVDAVPPMHRGSVDSRNFRQELRTRIITTVNALSTVPHPLDYEMHAPMPLETEQARVLMSLAPKRILFRTWLGNTARIGGELTMDVKSRAGEVHNRTFVSSGPKSLQSLIPYLEERLPRSMYGQRPIRIQRGGSAILRSSVQHHDPE